MGIWFHLPQLIFLSLAQITSMKPTLQLLLGLSLLLLTTNCQSASSETLNQLRKTKFPSFEEVYTNVNKQITAPGKDCQFGLAKKKDGYYLKVIPYIGNEFKEPKFLKAWDAATQKYLKLEIKKYLSEDYYETETYKEGLESTRNLSQNFDFNYLYGYPNYTSELITLLKDQQDLTNKELEMLARAYSNEACDYIHPNQLGSEVTATKDLPDPMYEKINPDRISSFMKLAEQSIACYKKIKANDPNYKTTIIENLDLKINHDLMNYYLQLKSVQEDGQAEGFLKLVNYKSDALNYAKSLLDACTQNGVLITFGDSDSFPLWFAQEKLHYRPDVIVINHSLLQAQWYFDYIKHTTPVKSAFSKKEYAFYNGGYVILRETDDQAKNYPEWLSELKSTQKISDPKQANSWQDMPQAPKNLLIDIQGTPTLFSSDRGYLVGVDLCMLDLLNSNKERSFFCSSAIGFNENSLKEHLAKRNVAYELVPAVVNSNWDSQSTVKLKEGLQKNPVTIAPSGTTDIQKGILYSICLDWILLPEEEKQSSKPVFDLFLKQLPIQKVAESSDLKLVQLYGTALWEMDVKKAEEFSDKFAPGALKVIDNIDEQAVCSETDGENLYAIYSIYFGRNNFEITYSAPAPRKYSTAQQQVMKALKNKINKLCSNPLNIQNLSWTMDILKRIKEGTDLY